MTRQPTIDARRRPAIMAGMAIIKSFDTEKYVSVGTAAKVAGVSRFWMRQQIQKGYVAGIEIDGQWFALLTSVVAFKNNPAAIGRPRGGKHAD